MAEGLREVVLDGLGWRGRHRVEEDWGLLVRLRFQLRDEDGLVQGREHVVLPAHRGEHPASGPEGAMLAGGTWTIGGKAYRFDSSGACLNP